jgi:hypothetical protein
MRLVLSAIIILVAVNLGLTAINSVSKLQDARMEKLCKIDVSYCTK